MATVKSITTFEVQQGGLLAYGKHGRPESDPRVPLETTVTGLAFVNQGTIADDTGIDVWDAVTDLPSQFDKLHIWSDTAIWVQLHSAGGSVAFQMAAKDPFVLTSGVIHDAYDGVDLSSGDPPSGEPIERIRLFNGSGGVAAYRIQLVD